MMQGRRVGDGEMRGSACFESGAYGRVLSDGEWIWYARTPNGLLGDLTPHEVVEHEDGTISVNPSIEVSPPPGREIEIADDDALMRSGGREGYWHGFLERGVWRSC
jgi:hypothetical protein